ncbi:thioesterase [Fischerella thermalis]|jgi:surfactin synthase thioesterase subunit|uniref:Thioesterase n=1 Tax=Fischerella thermalis JSC-11 TaxID=741277 RepID=G6FSF9_9CYAN|nr:thioesterase [Fischerella thermalis]PLZ08290.1 thioesterase [Fischerella thermalis WC1110]PLZ10050.1 thioesterase [Fischerella thermalis WC114]PLZ10900.1 thioesterase [Fischerella thermalis WC119]PLZ18441.1 thioesterase [Fischerella thermalis WC341]PLZ19672.1 thioesterase [Fischerella thermalis WC157]PLZ24572.1 thioesterase [Fischerella thermalis WC559]PLZ27784.1 thioesterase [Fischerella thermalis WC558]PLZ31922.1 thioesterase [Fischerella thermalis WC542]PLZ37174.1 thioesterase [Fisch
MNPFIHALGEPAFKEELRYLNGTPETVPENTKLMQLLTFLEETFNICSGYFDCTKACQLH